MTLLAKLATQLNNFVSLHPEQHEPVTHMLELLTHGRSAFSRSFLPGHFTASCWLVDHTAHHALLTHHKKLNRWLQLGGHADGDTDLAAVAMKEAHEESGLLHLSLEDDAAIFDVDIHTIPARGAEPEHLHFDVRYLVRNTQSEALVISDESHALAWVPITSLLDESVEESIRRMAQRFVRRPAS
jgi:8-oxo-dGTP pyrophosphatase MutT (NUDIX family)